MASLVGGLKAGPGTGQVLDVKLDYFFGGLVVQWLFAGVAVVMATHLTGSIKRTLAIRRGRRTRG